MSYTYKFYVVDEGKLLDVPAHLPDRRKHELLTKVVEERGANWGELELDDTAFADALEAIDEKIGDTDFLPVLAHNNSPRNILGDNADCPFFGYFSPEQVRDLHDCLADLQSSDVASLSEDDATDSVLYTLRGAAAEAAKRRYALSILHT